MNQCLRVFEFKKGAESYDVEMEEKKDEIRRLMTPLQMAVPISDSSTSYVCPIRSTICKCLT
jgi:hypothetical protein